MIGVGGGGDGMFAGIAQHDVEGDMVLSGEGAGTGPRVKLPCACLLHVSIAHSSHTLLKQCRRRWLAPLGGIPCGLVQGLG